ncbi:MAG: DEAD/DEAH box helicase [Anaerolineales bacterium]|nr:DEAD/DEAH box helicase [Anaerolineales bacterium]
MNFEQFNLDARLLKAVQQFGYTTPTPIQEQAIPHLLAGRDLMGLAQTGTGKTAAFILPILQHLTTGTLRQPRALILAPTRELAEQIYEHSHALGKFTPVRSTAIYGGVSKNKQIDRLRRGVEIVIACPGRLLDHIDSGTIDLSHVEIVVLDEADRMCDMGFLPDIRRILKKVPQRKQSMFFSATMPDDIRKLSQSILKNPAEVQIDMNAPAKTVSHALYPVPTDKKKVILFSFLQQTGTGRVLIFTRTKHRARSLGRDLENKGFNTVVLQGNMSQNARQQSINSFKAGKADFLVATDIAARGIDVQDISHVINYDMPDTVDAYTHRIGRTGRAEQTGEALTFAVQEDADQVYQIEKVLKTKLERRRLAGFDYGSFEPERQFPGRSAQHSQPKRTNYNHGSGGNHSQNRNKRSYSNRSN